MSLAGVAVLGPIEAWAADGRRVELGTPRQKALLAVLSLRANTPVSAEALLDAVWGPSCPASATQLVHTYMYRLRRAIQPDSPKWHRHGVLSTVDGRYTLSLPSMALDVRAFEGHVTRAAGAGAGGNVRQARDMLDEALRCWRGEPFAGLPGPLLDIERRRLQERRLSVRQDRLELELRLGRHRAIVPELQAMVCEDPLHEQLVELLMLALYRGGRQSDALRLYEQTRRLLDDELGVQPGAGLRQLHLRLLRAAEAGAGDGEPEIGQSDIGQPLGLGSLAVGGAATPVLAAPVHTPAQLPRDIADFTGREAESASLAGLLAAGGGAYVPVGVIAGRPGVGKTALAVHVAHQVRAEFPDGQLYLDLHGGSVSPTSPASALEYLLRSVGLSLAELPESFQQRAALFRTWLAGQRILIVADDARDEEHVRALLPGSPGCAVLITSRTPLVGIDGARHLHLQSFDPADGLRMLRNVVGAERVDAEPAPAADIVAACAGLPLAVHIAAGKLTARPHWSLRHLAALLADESRRLDELVCADRAVRRSIALTADLLTPAQREAFMTLSLAELPTFDVAAAAAILGTTHTQAAELVDALVESHLVDVAGWSPTDEFQVRFHDLVRLYAREQAAAHLDPQVGRAALTRLLDRYLALATIADAALPLSTDSYLAAAPSRVAQCEPALFRWLASNADAWFEAESTNLTSPVHQAARTGLDSYTWRIMNKTASFTMLHSRRELWTGAGPVAVDCARRTGDRLGEGITLLAIGKLESERTEGRQGGTELEAALRVFRDIGDDRGQARALKDLALRASLNGDTQAGTDLVAEALRIAEGLGDEVATADALGIQSSLRLAAGDSAGALQSALRAQRLCQRMQKPRCLAQALTRVAACHRAAGDDHAAQEILLECLTVVEQFGDTHGQACVLRDLGSLRVDDDRGAGYLDRCLVLCEQLQMPRIRGQALYAYGHLHLRRGDQPLAHRCLQESLQIMQRLGNPIWQRRVSSTLDTLATPPQTRFDPWGSERTASVPTVASRLPSCRHGRG